MKKKINCECGITLLKASLGRHKNSIRHKLHLLGIEYIESPPKARNSVKKCICGHTYTRCNKIQHYESKKHINSLKK